MEHINSSSFFLDFPSAVAIGNFDGLHIGHKELIDAVKIKADRNNLKTVIFTFNPHPCYVLNPAADQKLITTYEEKKLLINRFFIDYYIEYPFNLEFAGLDAKRFIKDIIIDKLNCKVLVVGDNFNFGKSRAGDICMLKEFADKYNIELVVINKKCFDGIDVSSSAIRAMISDIETVNRFLVFPYAILGKVTAGRHIGRTTGFPTINFYPDRLKLLPSNGVYISCTVYNNVKYKSITNIGYNPTVSSESLTIETHLFDFDKDIYDETVIVFLLKFIRQDIKFLDIYALTRQLEKDKLFAINYLLKNFKYYDNIPL